MKGGDAHGGLDDHVRFPCSVTGHFGRSEPEFTWEKTDKVDELKKRG